MNHILYIKSVLLKPTNFLFRKLGALQHHKNSAISKQAGDNYPVSLPCLWI